MQSDSPKLPEALCARSKNDRIDLACDAFEQAWRQGKHPELASFLANIDTKEQRQLFRELLLVEWELRVQQHDRPNWDEYFGKFPRFSDIIESIRFQEAGLDAAKSGEELPIATSKKIARFELLAQLGSGAVGSIWKAYDPRLQRQVAVKIPRNTDLSENEIGQFLKEARAAAQLRHPGIVAVHEVGRQDGSAYIVSELIEGTDLRFCLEQSKLAPRPAAQLCLQIAVALQHAHGQGIIHRDLKPANVLLDTTGEPHIADFGLAKQLSVQSTTTGSFQVLGTPAYMSPEQAGGNSCDADARSDVYSLGVILYEVLTGAQPYNGSFDDVLRAILTKQPVRPRQMNRAIPKDLELICIKAMEKEPGARYQTAAEMAEDLRRYLDGLPIKARNYRIAELAWRAVRRRLAIVSTVIITTCAVGGSAWMWWNLPKTTEAPDGPRSIHLETQPPGANILFVPISKFDGEPDPKHAIKAPTVSPIEMKLPPGEYWVEAVLPDGRFHEVIRNVARQGEWSDKSVQDAVNVLREITIPYKGNFSDMVYVYPGEDVAFYIDQRQLNARDLNSEYDRSLRGSPAQSLDYGTALRAAESYGLRLPTNSEWELAQRFLSRREANDLAEWTTSGMLVPDGTSDLLVGGRRYRDCRIVRGGSLRLIEGQNDISPNDYAAENTLPLLRSDSLKYPGLAIRCVRSVKPRFSAFLDQPQ